MKLQSVSAEVTKMMKILDEPTQKALTGLAGNNKELALMVQLYVYATDQGKISESFVEQVQKIKFQNSYKELDSFKDRQEFVHENLAPEPYTKWFEENNHDILKMIRYIQDNVKPNIEYNPITYLFIEVDTEGSLFKFTASEWLENHIEVLQKKILKLYKKASIRQRIGAGDTKQLNYKKEIERLDFLACNKIQKALLIKNGYDFKYGKDSDHNQKVIKKSMKLYANMVDRKYNKFLKKNNPQLKRFTYKSMVEDYFGNGFVFNDGENAPKLSTQLRKAKIEATQEEIRHFGEVRSFWDNWYSQTSTSLGYAIKTHGIYIDTENFKIPIVVDRFAFKDSCNRHRSSAGSDTHLILRELSCQYIKGYSLYWNRGKVGIKPSFRTYFFKEDDEIAHAGSYSDGHSNYNYTNYEFTTVLLCILFGRKIDDFKSISGLNINCRGFDDKNLNTYYFWSNMGDYNDYTTIGTCANILNGFCEEDVYEAIEQVDTIEYFVDNLSQERRDKFLEYDNLIPFTENTNTYFEI